MEAAKLTIDPAFEVGPVERRLFGSFVEHMGRSVYTGVFEPGHPAAGPGGLRRDVIELTREMGVSVVRYPGGNFVSNYDWEDGVGPAGERPTRLDLAWRQIETNAFGLDEFMTWTRQVAAEPMLAVNLGTRGVREACDLLEYANHPSGTRWSDLRVKHGAREPYGVRLWCLGNEMDGPWQIGGKTAYEYGRLAAETAKAMRRVDPRVELVACGSSNSTLPTFASWEATVLEQCYEHVDYISAHNYYDPAQPDRASYLASAADMEAQIHALVATADHVAARLRSPRRLKISFDEWNVWSQSLFGGEHSLDWAEAPRIIEEEYDAAAAAVAGSLLITLLANTDRVGIACQAQLANVIAPIRTEPGGPAWRQTIFHPFALTAAHARGRVLRLALSSPVFPTERYGEVPALVATATHDDDAGSLAVFAVNRSETPLPVQADLRALTGLARAEHLTVGGGDPAARNTRDAPDRVVPRPAPGAALSGGRLSAVLPPLSFNVLRLSPA
ncbi:alpha-N-arabinofuranosidase [Sphaerisporangium rufum]|uniref:non-reducing end alpha-L-arabinofuranosidase n=1 Tax=Sphaerisporangium rufum TaxID=1381558 RepID=A0A919V0K2_9ACTN|nr:alpha-N-arabinofuranosidase [Sphaerisporangium rufum]GII76798.1 alpha-N-arabinofuranosidase [Sphaerisporangium rufum]